jgi:endogenous inhibitor of DNA gyrase (YacG/DUF329 family)
MQANGSNGKNGSGGPVVSAKPCPNCGKAPDEKFRPFCSKRCADVDLHRWLSGSYAIPVKEDEDEDGEKPGDAMPGEDEPEKR